MGRLQNLRQGVGGAIQRRRENRQNQLNNTLKKDENVKLVDNNQQPEKPDNNDQQPQKPSDHVDKNPQQNGEQKGKLRAIANVGRSGINLGRKGINVVLRRRGSQQDASTDTLAEDPALDEDGEPLPCPKKTLIALHEALSNQSELQVIKYLVARHPQGAAAMKDGNLPLHTAVTYKAPVSVVEFLLEEYPEATGVRNKRYKLPIHIACECKAPLDAIKLLVKKDPDSLQIADYDISSLQFQKVWIVHAGKFSMDSKVGLPLHYACKYLCNLQVIHFLITEYPDAARTKNKDGWLPVHHSCARGAPLQTVQYLMTACPSSLYERTLHYYEYPMHLAAGRVNANINVVKYIQSRHSIACTQTKPNEGLYLTYYDEACLQSAPPSVSWFLSDVCAKAHKGYAYISTAEDPYN